MHTSIIKCCYMYIQFSHCLKSVTLKIVYQILHITCETFELLFTHCLLHILFTAVYLTTFYHRILLEKLIYNPYTRDIIAPLKLGKDLKGIFKEVCAVYGNKCMSLRQVTGGSANSTMANFT